MYRRTHQSWREPKTPFRSVGEIYLDSDMFSSDDEGAKTIGKPIIGPDALEILANRRKIKGRLNDFGAEQLKKVVNKVKELYPDEEVKVTWDRYCGCSMCPCSPGYRIKVRFSKGGFSSNEKNRFSLHLTTNKNNVEYSFFKPKDGFWIGYDKVRRLQEIFSNGKPEPEKS